MFTAFAAQQKLKQVTLSLALPLALTLTLTLALTLTPHLLELLLRGEGGEHLVRLLDVAVLRLQP